MIRVIPCDNCNKTGSFDLALTFNYSISHCVECKHTENKSWTYYFCDVGCMFMWLRKNSIEEKGFPCRDCINFKTKDSTGFTCGDAALGVCKTCEGTKTVKTMKWPYSGDKTSYSYTKKINEDN